MTENRDACDSDSNKFKNEKSTQYFYFIQSTLLSEISISNTLKLTASKSLLRFG